MAKIEKLTPEQEAELPRWRDRYFRYGISADPIDEDVVRDLMRRAYAEIDEKCPPVIIADSPWHASEIICTLENDGLKPKKITPQFTSWWGQMDLYWVAFYKFCQWIGVEYPTDAQRRLDLMDQIGKSQSWWYPREDACVVVRRPEVVKMDDQEVLHCENGPAVRFADGFSLYSWRGVRVPEGWIMGDELTPGKALAVENAEQRRAACEILGWGNMLKDLGAVSIDKDPDPTIGELLEVDHEAVGGKVRFLRMFCPTGRWFAEPVPPEIKTALEGNAWGWGLAAELYKPAQQS